MQNQSKDAFHSDTKKNPKVCMVVTLRSGRELESRKEEEKKKTEKDEQEETEKEDKLSNLELVKETKKEEVQIEQHIEKGKLKKKEEMQAYKLAVPFSPRLQKEKLEEQFSRFLEMFKKIEINIPFAKALVQMPNYTKFLKYILSKKKEIC